MVGSLVGSNQGNQQLMEGPMQREEHCAGVEQTHSSLYPEQLCYKRLDTAKKPSTCSGDPDGPIMYRSERRLRCIIGIFSFLVESGSPDNRSCVFTAVSLQRSWISQQLAFLHSDRYTNLLPGTLYIDNKGMIVYDHLNER